MCAPLLPSAARRQLLLAGAASLTLARFATGEADAAEPADANAPNAIAPAEALTRLMDGNARYVANAPANKDYSAGRASRVTAQYPIAAIVGCADSRVSPELAFDQEPGNLFVVRVAGNFVNEDGLASLEYGVKFLQVPLIVVLGHTNCGAVSATVDAIQKGVVLPGHLPDLVRSIKPAVAIAQLHGDADLKASATVENVRLNANRLSVSKPIIGGYVKEGKVKVVGGIYDLATGKVNLL
ncbi:carbonic anhydrase [Paraburkholderia phenazinium]|jgi:carbonic anhydrase|uniref:carbonic anhydrase n=1 Tax=Paraburkholderia phenazinium TaxID=60549 RepID=A0A1G8G093_9BURK|nr:carbonic anhydrase [Paraburkholderia phenazinium]SDH87760.1 carbonic anhydrase [Paraburkholderia phenazinium]